MISPNLTATIILIAALLRSTRPLTVETTNELLITFLGHDAKAFGASVLVALEDSDLAECREGGWYRGPRWAAQAAIHGWQI